MTRELLSWIGGLLFVASLLGGLYLLGRHHGAEARDDWWRAGMAKVDAEVGRQAERKQAAADALARDVEAMRARPERIRTVTKEIIKHVVADADCSSLPESVRVLWAAGGADDPAAGAAGVADAAGTGLAGAVR